jgi:hypothetical protein
MRRAQQTYLATGEPTQPADMTPLPLSSTQKAWMLVPPGVRRSLLYRRRRSGSALIQSIQCVATQTLGRCRWARASSYQAIRRRCTARKARRIHARIASTLSLQLGRDSIKHLGTLHFSGDKRCVDSLQQPCMLDSRTTHTSGSIFYYDHVVSSTCPTVLGIASRGSKALISDSASLFPASRCSNHTHLKVVRSHPFISSR